MSGLRGRQKVVGKGEEEVQTSGVKNPLVKLSDRVREPDCNHGHDVGRGDNILCNRIQVSALPRLEESSCKLATIQRVEVIGVCTDIGGVRGQSRTEIAQKEPAHGYQWSGEGHHARLRKSKPK